jgi:hypothetical protein
MRAVNYKGFMNVLATLHKPFAFYYSVKKLSVLSGTSGIFTDAATLQQGLLSLLINKRAACQPV